MGFVPKPNGLNEALRSLGLLLSISDVTHIGMILDANDAGVQRRWNEVRKILARQFPGVSLVETFVAGSPLVISLPGPLRFGLWIMPDYQAEGYFEHFLERCIPDDDLLLHRAKAVVQELRTGDLLQFGWKKDQKAIIHTWLAWQKEPGTPIGRAVKMKIFDLKAEPIQALLAWYRAIFELEGSA